MDMREDGAAVAVTFNSGDGVAEALTFNSVNGVAAAITCNSADAEVITFNTSGGVAAAVVTFKSGNGEAEAVTFNSGDITAEAVAIKSGGGVAGAITIKSVDSVVEDITFKSGDGAADAVAMKSGDGYGLSGEVGVDFGALASTGIASGELGSGGLASPVQEGTGSTGLGVSLVDPNLHVLVTLTRPASGANGHVAGVVRGVSSPPALAYPPLGADPALAFAPAGSGDLRRREGDPLPLPLDMAANFRLAASGGMVRPQASVLAMIVGAMAIVGEPDAPWPSQLGALLVWFGGCIALFLSWN